MTYTEDSEIAPSPLFLLFRSVLDLACYRRRSARFRCSIQITDRLRVLSRRSAHFRSSILITDRLRVLSLRGPMRDKQNEQSTPSLRAKS